MATIRDTNLTPFSDSPLTELKLQQKQATSPIILSSKKSGYILQLLGDAGVAAGELEKLKTIYSDFLKQNQYVEVRVRIPEVHSYLDPLAVAEHDCICIALKGDYLKVGAPVQVSFEDPVDTRRGYIINSQNVTGDGSKSKNKDDNETVPNSDEFLDPTATGTKKDNKPVPVDKGFLGLPFKCEVRGKLQGVRQVLIEEAKKIAEYAGWYYGATKTAVLQVTSGLRAAKPGNNNGNHQSGNAIDFEIEIDNIKLGRMESYAFVATMELYGLLRGKRMGLYLDPKVYDATNGVVGVYGGSRPHYDLRVKKRRNGRLGKATERWVKFYENPKDNEAKRKYFANTGIGLYKLSIYEFNNLDKKAKFQLPKSVRLRIKQLYLGFDPYTVTAGAPTSQLKVAGLLDEVKKQQTSWESWKKTEAGKSFGGAINTSSEENQKQANNQSATTIASFAWKLSVGGPLGSTGVNNKSPTYDDIKNIFNVAAIADLRQEVALPDKSNNPITVGEVYVDDTQIVIKRPYPTRVAVIPVKKDPQLAYFNYWKGRETLSPTTTNQLTGHREDAASRARNARRRRGEELLKDVKDGN